MWTSPVSKREAMDKNARDWQMGSDLANEGSRLWGKMQGYIQGHTPLDTERHCTDCLFIPLFLAAIVGLGLCINHAMEKGSFQRLTSLPDFEGHLCGTDGQGQYVYFCQQGGTLDLQHQICVPSCPVDSSTQIFCRGTGTNQPSYATHPVAGMVCMPAAAEVASQARPGGGGQSVKMQCFSRVPYYEISASASSQKAQEGVCAEVWHA